MINIVIFIFFYSFSVKLFVIFYSWCIIYFTVGLARAYYSGG